MRRARARDGCSRSAVVDAARPGPKFRQSTPSEHVDWRAPREKHPITLSPASIPSHGHLHTAHMFVHRTASLGRASPHISHPRTGTVEPLRRRADEQPENRLAESVHVVIRIAKSPPERGAPLQGQPRPKGSSVDNQALHPLDLLGRDHGVEPREKLLALRLIIERARVLVLCAVR